MITCRLYRDGNLEKKDFDPRDISEHLKERDVLIWLDVEDPSTGDVAMLQEEFEWHELAVEDVQHRGQRPKVDVYEGFFFVVMHGLKIQGDQLVSQEIHAFVGPSYLVTLRYEPAFDLSQVLRRWERDPVLTRQGGGFLLYALLDEVVDGYHEIVDRFEDLSEDLEEEVFTPVPPDDLQERIFLLKKKVIGFRRLVMPLREVLDLLQEEPRIVTAELSAYYRDVADHVIRTAEFIENVRDLLTTALEAHLAQASNRMNLVMKKLTSWGAIILVPTLVAGIYGMNFRFMPELEWRLGYPFAIGVMALSGFVLYRVFRGRGWL